METKIDLSLKSKTGYMKTTWISFLISVTFRILSC